MQHCTIQSIYSDWDTIVKDPPYQRNGDVWSLEKKQLLIDSIINRYDIPKLYFHQYEREHARKVGKSFAIIDGRQRLETIVKFIEDVFPLGDDFNYLEDESVSAAGMNYSELAKKYPKIKSRFDSFSLPIITVETDDLELIEDMFSRLNEAVPLNAPEKRRSIGGDMVEAIDMVAEHDFFKKKVKFSNKRYQHKEAAVRLLFIFHNLHSDRMVDTKKPFLDSFTFQHKSGKKDYVNSLKQEVITVLQEITSVFIEKDSLLFAQANLPIYVLAYRELKSREKADLFTRTRLINFNDQRTINRTKAESDIAAAQFELLEYDRLSQQGTNDASSIRERLKILVEWLIN
jgi:septum formation topological specificity factor MinE